ncbi:membrane hypothetical protein [uncultured Eubacteriales bacterium]|uniref:ABC3 transporter permease C-terminal domain-containing protein n=1 Tax=uncultured Eubacteriales bacterium TaxID=172733 RepID=A0A212K7U3_9FIRM|nr:membrane hypothetical protein [uncultured Eubacteriales bacterium]
MNIVNRLTVRHLRLNRSRTLMTIMGIMLSVAMVCAVAGFVASVHDLLLRQIKQKGDYHVVYTNVTKEIATEISSEEIFSTHYTKDSDTPGHVNLYLRFASPGRDVNNVASQISQKFGVEKYGLNYELLGLEGIMIHKSVIVGFIGVAVIAVAIIMTGSIIVISNAFYISATERVRQFGLLKSIGATSGQIGRSILFEALTLAAISIPLGIALGFLIDIFVLWVTNYLLVDLNRLNNGTFSFRVVFHPLIPIISLLVALLTILISAWLPARKAAKTTAIEAIRQTKDIKISGKRIKTSPAVRKLFGFEGTLAAKSLKRSRGKYRATVISLTVSVVMFVSMWSLVDIMKKDAEMQYGGLDFDVLVMTQGDLETVDKADAFLRTIPDAAFRKVQETSFSTTAPKGFVTERMLSGAEGETERDLNLYAIPDADFVALAQVKEGEIPGVLINTTGALRKDGQVQEFVPYEASVGTKLPLERGRENEEKKTYGDVTIAATVDKIPDSIPAIIFNGNLINIMVPESIYRTLFQANNSRTAYAVTAQDPQAFCDSAEELLLPLGETIQIQNVAQSAHINQNIVLIIMLFGYGFIGMLSLIAVTSAITTISTGMELRRHEFAMLYSAGMTPRGMDKMLHLESLLYGIKSLAFGLPIGVGLSIAMHRMMANVFVFRYALPWDAMLISTIAVLMLTFSTMQYGKHKFRKVSIVEAIRSEIV